MRDKICRPTIIVACPEDTLRRVLVHTLGTLECRVESVASHKALVSRTLRRDYAVVLTCFHSPLVGSRHEVALLRGNSCSPSSLFVLARGLSANEVVTLLDRGVEQVLSLPVSTTRLRSKIQNTLLQGRAL